MLKLPLFLRTGLVVIFLEETLQNFKLIFRRSFPQFKADSMFFLYLDVTYDTCLSTK